MRKQPWIAEWEEEGRKQMYCFVSQETEYLARLSFQIALLKENRPIPAVFTLRKVGEPG